MKSTGVVRNLDKMGRLVIPKEIRKNLNMKNSVDGFEIYTEHDKIILKKYQPSCIFCDSVEELIDFKGYKLCKSCIKKCCNRIEYEEQCK